MSQKRVGNDEFLSQLGELLASTTAANHGSVFLTQKPLDVQGSTESVSQVLIRATNGATTTKSKKPGLKITKEQEHKKHAKIKLATVVDVSDLESFYIKYADVCKKGMEGMRKRDKKKAKEKAKAAKKKKGNAAAA